MLKFEEVMNYITNCEKTRQLSLAQCPWNNYFSGPRKEEINLENPGGTGVQAGDKEGPKGK